MNEIIRLEHVTKTFSARRGPRHLSGALGLLGGQQKHKFTALKDISLNVERGESLGIIGRNGSGKSTLLSIIAGITVPSEGRVQVFGRVASLLELGAGFNPILTGRENIYLNAGLLGMRKAQVDAVYDEIVQFSGISEFMDQPVDTYSSGMYVRIGFSVAAFVNPDIFIADEVLAVGDAEFQRKCRAKMGELREQGKTIVFVSHDLGLVSTLCERIVLLDKGQMIQRETAQKAITYYLRRVGAEKGVHAFRSGKTEAIFCEGRISLFHNEEEVSAPTGFQMELKRLGMSQFSTDAEWTVHDAHPAGCRAVGKMLRVPVLIHWDMYFENDLFTWNIAIEPERDISIEEINVRFAVPTRYNQWIYGGHKDFFPEIVPGDTSWRPVAVAHADITDTACLSEEDASLPSILFHARYEQKNFYLYWLNADYMTNSRALCAQAVFPEQDSLFKQGQHKMISLSLDLAIPADELEKEVFKNQVLKTDSLEVQFQNGRLFILRDNQIITHLNHIYASLLLDGFLVDGFSFHWENMGVKHGALQCCGKSRRFPFSQLWEISVHNNTVSFTIWLQVEKELKVKELYTTIVLPQKYTYWKTDYETDVFPDYDQSLNDWIHCNSIFRRGTSVTAWGENMPEVKLSVDQTCPPVYMTAINTTYYEHGRALQAFRTSKTAELFFSPGKHLHFSGQIEIGPPKSTDE